MIVQSTRNHYERRGRGWKRGRGWRREKEDGGEEWKCHFVSEWTNSFFSFCPSFLLCSSSYSFPLFLHLFEREEERERVSLPSSSFCSSFTLKIISKIRNEKRKKSSEKEEMFGSLRNHQEFSSFLPFFQSPFSHQLSFFLSLFLPFSIFSSSFFSYYFCPFRPLFHLLQSYFFPFLMIGFRRLISSSQRRDSLVSSHSQSMIHRRKKGMEKEEEK